MSTCTKWVDKIVIECKNWAEKIDYVCTEWADEGSNKCSDWADEGSSECSDWADEGSNECSNWADEGSSHCCTWWPCSWGCKAYYWVSKWVCKGWYWVANWVCKAWYWVAKWVCKAWYWVAKWVCKVFAWVVKAVCVIWSWAAKLVCVAWDTLKCFMLNLMGKLFDLFGAFSRDSKKGPAIEHVFVLVLENQSFDHLLGFSNLTGTDAITGEDTSINGVDPAIHKNRNPVSGDDIAVSSPSDFFVDEADGDPGHEFDNTITQLCGKKDDGTDIDYDPVMGGYPDINNSGFIADYIDRGAANPDKIMECYSPEQLPILHTLASEFAICDNWFSSMPGPTFPNRFFLHAATSGGLDDSPGDLDIVSSTTVDGFRFENGNIFDEMDDKCVEWEIFEGDEFPVSFALAGMNLNALQGRFTDFSEFEESINSRSYDKKFIFIEPKYGRHEFNPFGPGDFKCGNSMHPLDDVTRGEKLIKKVYETIRNSPHWEKSMLVITLDEHGGFYDHVAPPAAVPPGDLVTEGMVHNDFKFDQLGVRVPAIIVSPLVKKGVIDHTLYDHTSLLATVERLMGLSSLTERDKAANDFLHLFSLSAARTDAPQTLPDVAESGFGGCDDEDEGESVDMLVAQRYELLKAIKSEKYFDKSTREIEVARSQVGFNIIALLKVLSQSDYPEREKWKEEFSKIKTGVDAALFMTEAKLLLKHSIDFKKIMRQSEKANRMKKTNRKKDKK